MDWRLLLHFLGFLPARLLVAVLRRWCAIQNHSLKVTPTTCIKHPSQINKRGVEISFLFLTPLSYMSFSKCEADCSALFPESTLAAGKEASVKVHETSVRQSKRALTWVLSAIDNKIILWQLSQACPFPFGMKRCMIGAFFNFYAIVSCCQI